MREREIRRFAQRPFLGCNLFRFGGVPDRSQLVHCQGRRGFVVGCDLVDDSHRLFVPPFSN